MKKIMLLLLIFIGVSILGNEGDDKKKDNLKYLNKFLNIVQCTKHVYFLKGQIEKNIGMVENTEQKIIVLLHVSYKNGLFELDFLTNFIESNTLEDFAKEYKLNKNLLRKFYNSVFITGKSEEGKGLCAEYLDIKFKEPTDYWEFLKSHFDILPVELIEKCNPVISKK